MDRRTFLRDAAGAAGLAVAGLTLGCRSHQFGHIVSEEQPDVVGSHAAGAAVFNPLIDEAVGKLLSRQAQPIQTVGYDGAEVIATPKSICFIGVENKSIEELGDFKDQIYQQIDTMLVQSKAFNPISRRMVDVALRETRLRPDALLLPDNMQLFSATLQRQGQPIDALLYATLTSGTTVRNKSAQRDYLLTLELVDVHTGAYDKESAKIRKGYHKTRAGKWWHYNPLKSVG